MSPDQSETDFEGYIEVDMILKGESSGAAKVTSRRLITDRVGTVIGSYRVPSSDDPSASTFETGRSMLRLTSSSTNSKVPGVVTTAEDIFYSRGDQDNTQERTLSLRKGSRLKRLMLKQELLVVMVQLPLLCYGYHQHPQC